MKKLFFLSFVLITSSSAFAQFEKGRILAGGDLSFASTTNKTKGNNATVTNYKLTTFGLSPKVGYFFIDNLAAGLSLNLSAGTQKDEGSSDKYSSTSVSIGPFVRYYLQPGVFFQGQFGGGSIKRKNEVGNTTTTTKYGLTNWSIGAGYAYFLNKNVALEPFIGYGANIEKNKSNDVKDIDSSLFISVGFQVYLDRK